ncbi:MAG TPA: nicotinate-nucleotide--dimethylbenzimidazole phosphoribosyltransferase [Candidatus Dormibacteraeota bacterium]|nr:nicotinate-nucleotide--dimethylbenzimidazole phosphoribosyltransferase [Candidatus Dormibacteraeota bacterium]
MSQGETPRTPLAQAIAAIEPLDEEAMVAARAHQDDLTKPPGSLGRLEEVAVQLAGIRRRDGALLGPCAVLVCAADHGVAASGVSAYPAEVTPQMVLNFLGGGAAINVLARQVGARVVVLDAGVAADLPAHPSLLAAKVRRGTGNIVVEAAMSRAEAQAAVEAGISAAWALADEGVEALAVGDMGIGNTTAASAVVAGITGAAAAEVVGRGTGVDDAGLARKVAAVEAAVVRAGVDPDDGLGVVAELGGLEIAAIAGAVLGAASRRMCVVIDGHPATAGALVASLLSPGCTAYVVGGHRSVERGHRLALARLGVVPLLDLDLRLGEGTGACLALGLIQAAARLSAEMATFSSAGVSGPSGEVDDGRGTVALPGS